MATTFKVLVWQLHSTRGRGQSAGNMLPKCVISKLISSLPHDMVKSFLFLESHEFEIASRTRRLDGLLEITARRAPAE
eukprot:6178804-Pleurochrysis_carterae.AAC.2